MNEMNLNNVFGYFLKQKGIQTPRFKKTKYGYKTYDGVWKLFSNSLSIVMIKPAKVYNGHDYDNGYEEQNYSIIPKEDKISIVFNYTRLI